MTTLFQAALDLARLVNGDTWYEGLSSEDGTPTTMIDANRVGRGGLVEDNYQGAPLFFLSGTLADKSVQVTGYSQGDNEYTFETQSSAPGTGIRYGVGSKQFTRQKLFTAINEALIDIGDVKQVDITLTTVKDQVEYTLPTGVFNVKQVEIAQRTSAPYDYQEFHTFDEWQDTLVFPDHNAPSAAGFIIRLKYNAPHADVTTDAGVIATAIPRDLIKYNSAFHLLQRMTQEMVDRPDLLTVFQAVIVKAASMKSSFTPPKWEASTKMADWMGVVSETDRSLPN